MQPDPGRALGLPKWIGWNHRTVVWLAALAMAACYGPCTPEKVTGDPVLPSCVFNSVVIVPPATTVEVGETSQLTADVVRNGACDPYMAAFSSSNTAIATISSSGLVKGIAVGGPINASLTVTGKDPVTKTTNAATVTVTPPTVATLAVSPTTASILVNQTQPYTGTTTSVGGITPVPGAVVTWNSANPTIASIDQNTGVAKGLTVGTATIQGLVQGKSGQIVTNVTLMVTNVALVPVFTVTVTPNPGSVASNGQLPMLADTRGAGNVPLTGRSIAWTSSSMANATIDPNTGLVTGKAVGSTTITATSEGKSGTALVNVTGPLGSCTTFGDGFATANPFVSTISASTGGPAQTTAFAATGGSTIGGNTGYVHMTHTMPGVSTITVDHLFPGTYSAATLGAVAYFEYHEDRIDFNQAFVDDGGGLLIKQGANLYRVTLPNGLSTPSVWTRLERLNIRPSDVPGLDFSAAGAPIQFGFWRDNSGEGVTQTSQLGIDNFEVKVCR